MFGEVVTFIVFCTLPVNPKLVEQYFILHSVEVHVEGFGRFVLYSRVKETGGGVVVSFNWSGALGVA